jgi:hypothetical protein
MTSTFQERNVELHFEDWEVDLFTTESGNLGMTISKLAENDELACTDIFVDAKTLQIRSDRCATTQPLQLDNELQLKQPLIKIPAHMREKLATLFGSWKAKK